MPNLTGITALDVVIGLAFVYLLLSILCSALMEVVAVVLDMRAATLEQGLSNLLDDHGGELGGAPTAPCPAPPDARANGEPPPAAGRCPTSLTDAVLGHGLIRTQYRPSRPVRLRKRKRRGPSYLPAPMFATALLDVLAPTSRATDTAASLESTIADKNIPAGTKSALLALVRDADGNRDSLRKLVEAWFDAGMGRVSGWYKRKSQFIVCVVSLVVAVGLNVNTIAIADRLMRDDVVRSAVVGAAADTKPAGESGAPSESEVDRLNTAAQRIGDVKKLGVPIGWHMAKGDPARPDLVHHFGRTVGGWLITFLALSLGAPFWFDALSRLSALRAAGIKPAPKPASADA